MTKTTNFLAFDLGAESGRAVLGRFDGEQLSLSETHRFPNGAVRLPPGLYWNVLSLYIEIKRGLAKTYTESGGQLTSLGLDTWGVDFALLDRAGHLIGNPHHYRDSRNDGMLEKAFAIVPREEIFEQTGIQFMQINGLYQLLSMSLHKSPKLEVAATLLMMPDLFNYWLTGRRVCEYTDATTSQCFDPRRGWELTGKIQDPLTMLPGYRQPSTTGWSYTADVASEVGSAPRFRLSLPAATILPVRWRRCQWLKGQN